MKSTFICILNVLEKLSLGGGNAGARGGQGFSRGDSKNAKNDRKWKGEYWEDALLRHTKRNQKVQARYFQKEA